MKKRASLSYAICDHLQHGNELAIAGSKSDNILSIQKKLPKIKKVKGKFCFVSKGLVRNFGHHLETHEPQSDATCCKQKQHSDAHFCVSELTPLRIGDARAP